MIVLGLDGWTETEPIPVTDCCAGRFDFDPCALMRAMVQLLPRGPLWDQAKAEALARYTNVDAYMRDCGDECKPCAEAGCTSLVKYAVFLGQVLHDALSDLLAPMLRESSPATAILTVDRWLSDYGYESCFTSGCRDPRIGFEGPLYPPPAAGGCASDCTSAIPPDLDAAARQAMLEALRRLALRPRGNLASINFVIAPLGAELTVDPDATQTCSAPRFCLSPVSDEIPLRHLELGTPTTRMVRSWYYEDCNAGPKIRPAFLVAHCLALAMLPPDVCNNTAPIRWCNCEE